ncbi:MAG TPA: CAP domain-containing protein [Chloroflexota bacterium]
MKRHVSLLRILCLVLVANVTFLAEPILAAPLDFPVTDGRRYTEAAGGDGVHGFSIVDDSQARFWSEFKRLGGVGSLGYPASQRFIADGFTVQVMQKGVLQWRPEVGQVYLVNVFDQLSRAGKDDWLLGVRSTPRPLDPSFDAGKNWNEIVNSRRALLDANPAIKAQYYSATDPMMDYGLPTSRVVDNGNHYAIRLQRAVIQQWKVDVPWAKAGQVTVANGGDVGKEAGLFPTSVLAPEGTATDGTSAGSPQQTALATINHDRALAGAAPLTLDPTLNRSTAAHAAYYVQNHADGTMVGLGLHHEIVGKPGFTGVSWEDRARAAGNTDAVVDENIGLVGDPNPTIKWFIDTINHRWNLLSPSAVHLGYGVNTSPAVDVFDIGFTQARPSVSLPTVYPGIGQTGVPTSADLYETPDPAPGVPRPLGYPITVNFGISDNVSFASYSLVDQANQAVPIFTVQKQWLRALAIVPSHPLNAGQTYTVHVAGTVNGQPFAKTWSFTTSH